MNTMSDEPLDLFPRHPGLPRQPVKRQSDLVQPLRNGRHHTFGAIDEEAEALSNATCFQLFTHSKTDLAKPINDLVLNLLNTLFINTCHIQIVSVRNDDHLTI